jgi:thioredoxin reductase
MKISRISIVGGGIGGLTAALALQHSVIALQSSSRLKSYEKSALV